MADVSPSSAHPEPDLVTRRKFLLRGSIAVAGVALYGGIHGRHELQVNQVTLPIANLPDAFQGFRFVQMSDLHLEEYTEPWFLQHIVERVNALAPELVLITGDYISRGPLSDSVAWKAAGVCAEILTGLKAQQRFGILGNHDVAVGPTRVLDPLRAHGTPVLVNQHVPIERGSDRLWLCGTDDAGTSAPDLDRAVPSHADAPVILMVHEPDYADTVVHHRRFPSIDLMLSGHSHGGQIRLPWIGPLVLPPMGKKYVEGLFYLDHMQLYVNRGVGTVGLPIRLNCPPELTHFTLVRA